MMTWHWSSDEAVLNQWEGLDLPFLSQYSREYVFCKSCWAQDPIFYFWKWSTLFQDNIFYDRSPFFKVLGPPLPFFKFQGWMITQMHNSITTAGKVTSFKFITISVMSQWHHGVSIQCALNISQSFLFEDLTKDTRYEASFMNAKSGQSSTIVTVVLCVSSRYRWPWYIKNLY